MTFRFSIFVLAVVCTSFMPGTSFAGSADVVAVNASLSGPGIYRFDVSVLHKDEGWGHYANAFEIIDLDGNILGVRELAHPHDNEQPFTRSLGNVEIPPTVTIVKVRAIDSVHGLGGTEIELRLPLD